MAPQILFIATVLTVLWGVYLLGTIRLYVQAKNKHDRRMQDLVIALRRVVVAFCAWLFPFSFVFRTLCVILGVEDVVIGQIIFYSLLGANVTGSIYAIVSLWYD